MKSTGIALCCMLAVSTLFGQKVIISKVPSPVSSAFTKKFPGTSNVSWEVSNGENYEAEFTSNGMEQTAVFDSKGNWLETETEMEASNLPAPVSHSLAKQFGGLKIAEVVWIETLNNVTFYEVELQKGPDTYEVLLSPAGDVLKPLTKEDDDDEDDDEDEDED